MRRQLLLQTTKLLKNEVSRAEAELYNLLEWDFIDQPPKTVMEGHRADSQCAELAVLPQTYQHPLSSTFLD